MQSVTHLRLRIVITILVISFFILWWGVPTFNKWRADRLVDELCAKDGGIKVYETVELPPEKFDRWGRPRVPSKRFMESRDEFYYVRERYDIIGNSSTTDISQLTVFKSVHRIFRKSDKKLLGKSVTYIRSGGDPMGPWHPSSYSCRQRNDLESRIFQKSESS